MRILIVNEKCGFHGGVEQNVHDVAVGLTGRGHEVSLVHSEITPRDGTEYRRPFRIVARLPELADGGPGRSPRLAELIGRVAPDVIYVHRVPRVSLVLDAAGGRPVVRMIHDHDVYCPRRHKYHALGGQVCTRAAGWACWLDLAFVERHSGSTLGFRWSSISAKLQEMEDNKRVPRVVVASRYMRDQLRLNGFDEARIEVIAPAVRGAGVAPAFVPPPGAGRILYVGQLVRGKGVDLLLEAVAGLPGPWELDVVGEGNARPALERQARSLGIGDRVLFTGWIAPDALRDVYHRSNLVAVPSRWPEPFGMIGLEAMRAGRPVVGFAAGGIPDWLEDGMTGLLVEPGDVAGMRRAIGSLLQDRDRARQLGRLALRVSEEIFSFDRMLDSLEAVLGTGGMPSRMVDAVAA